MEPTIHHARDILPSNVKPVHYELSFEPELVEAKTFEGSVVIHLDVLEETSIISLNARELTILSKSITSGDKNVGIKELKTEIEKELITILLEDKLIAPSKIQLKISFTGSLVHQADGLYRSPYQAEDGTSKVCTICFV